MTTLGRNVRITIARTRRERFRAAMKALGCDSLSPHDDMDLYRFEHGSMLGAQVVSESEALPEHAMDRAPWLELVVGDVEGTAAKLDELGIARVYRSGALTYFRAPGGVVFRLAASRQ